ncbi:MAG: DUF4349 domain-containing protein [Ruthenibacterium sp.]
MKRLLAVFLICAVAVFYTACGGASAVKQSANSAPAMQMASGEAGYDGAAAPKADSENKVTGAAEGSALTEQQLAQDGRKIIYDSTLDIEALDFDATLQALNTALAAAQGYVSSTSLENDTYEGATRNATFVYRVPTDRYSAFLKALGDAGNVTMQQENTQDITAEYVDIEARISSLKLQEERLLTMMEKAGELETLLAIQEQLTDVQYRIESYTAQQRTFDNLVSYCTVTVRVREVKHITELKDTFGNRVGAAVRESWRNFGRGVQNFAVGAIYFLPTLLVLLVLAGIALVAVSIVRKAMAKRPAVCSAPTATVRQGDKGQAAQPAQYDAAQQNEQTQHTEQQPKP